MGRLKVTFDPDFGKTGFARRLLRLRFRTLKLSQVAFAHRFGLTLGAVKDAEQGRHQPSRALVLLVAAIERDASLMAGVAAAERAVLNTRPTAGHRWRKADDPQFLHPVNALATELAIYPIGKVI